MSKVSDLSARHILLFALMSTTALVGMPPAMSHAADDLDVLIVFTISRETVSYSNVTVGAPTASSPTGSFGSLFIGPDADATFERLEINGGNVNAFGSDTKLRVNNDIELKSNRFGATLNISNGAEVATGGHGLIDARGVGNIDGVGSRWTIGGDLRVDRDGILKIVDGGDAYVVGDVILQQDDVSPAAVVSVSGFQSSLKSEGDFIVGANGGATLNLAHSGLVQIDGVLKVASGVGSTGTVNIGAGLGDAAQSEGFLKASAIAFGAGAGTINFNHTAGESNSLLSSAVTGAGSLNFIAGRTRVIGDASGFTGVSTVTGGDLFVDSTLGGTVNVDRGTLSGSGVLSGSVSVTDGAISAGNGTGTLTVGGDLALASGASLNFELGGPAGAAGSDSDLVNVGGDLTLDGTLDVFDAGAFGVGLYRLINYGGTLTDNGLDIGLVPVGFSEEQLAVQTATAGQVNLLVNGPTPTSFFFWDGSNTGANHLIEGGSGSWTATGGNWTIADGSFNGVYDPSVLLIFSGAPGTVSLDDGADALTIANGMQFAVGGYTVTGGAIDIDGANVIRVGDGTTAGGEIVANISSTLSGTGSLEKTDLGTLILTGANTYSGGTTISGGSLVGDATSLQGDIENNARLIFNQETGGIYAGTISGNGALTKEGAGNLVLAANSTAFSGVTGVTGGLLTVNGSLGGTTYVYGGALGGTGALNDVVIGSGGAIAPANSIGTIHVHDIGFNAGSTYAMEFTYGGFDTGVDNDFIDASGAATINGGTVHVSAVNGSDDGSIYALGTYTVLSAVAGVTGAFDTVTDDFAFLKFSLGYDASNVFLTSSVTGPSFCLAGMTVNQCAAGDGAFSLGAGADVFDAVLVLSDAEAPYALDQISGEVYASVNSALFESSGLVRESALGRLSGVSAGVGTGFWMQSYGSHTDWRSDGNAATTERSANGFVLGGDGEVSNDVYLGFQAGYGHGSIGVSERSSSGNQESYTLGAYAEAQGDQFTLRGGIAHSWHELSTLRSVNFSGFTDEVSSDYSARTAQAYLELVADLFTPDAHFEPFANIAYVNLNTEGFSESGGAAALAATDAKDHAAFSSVGLRGGKQIDFGDMEATISTSLAWRHAFADTPSATHGFIAGGDRFTVYGVPIAKDTFVFDAGLVAQLSTNATFGLSYVGQVGSGKSEHGAKANLNIRF